MEEGRWERIIFNLISLRTLRKTSESAHEGCGIKSNLPFSSHLLSFACGSISPGLLVPQSLWRIWRGSYSWAICDQASGLNPINSWNVVGSLGLCNSLFWEKNALGLWAAGKLPKRKLILARSGLRPSQLEVEKQREASLMFIGFSGHPLEQSLFPSSEHSPLQVTASICLIHRYTCWLVSFIFGDKQFNFLDGFFFSLSPSYHGHKMLMYQQAIAKLPQCHLPDQHLFLHVCQPWGFVTTASSEETLARNWSCLNKIVISILIQEPQSLTVFLKQWVAGWFTNRLKRYIIDERVIC